MARIGYDYAVKDGFIPEFNSDMELMAFNAGVSNANIRNNLNVAPITVIAKNRVETKEAASYKELQTVWGQN